MQGANNSIDKIKKSAPEIYVKDESFQHRIVKMTTSQTDAGGKKLFRLKDDPRLLAMYDPYFYVSEKAQSAHQESYSSLYEKRPELNNYVGDYKGNYKY